MEEDLPHMPDTLDGNPVDKLISPEQNKVFKWLFSNQHYLLTFHTLVNVVETTTLTNDEKEYYLGLDHVSDEFREDENSGAEYLFSHGIKFP